MVKVSSRYSEATMTLQSTYGRYVPRIDAELKALLSPPHRGLDSLYGMMRYHLGWTDQSFRAISARAGKRLRAALCLLACEATGGDWERALPAAAAVELIHNFTLLHDDVEDKSHTRRGRATLWSLWGIAQAINAGDAMWAIARLAVYRLLDLEHDAESALRVAMRLDETCLHLCVGQHLDLCFESADLVTLAQYQRMIAAKTATLLAAALAAGAILGGARKAVVDAYSAFGQELGLTYQITDDILGTWGDPTVTGKSAASDILSKKKTLPVLYTLQRERELGERDLAGIYAQATLSEDDVPAVLELLGHSGALEYSRCQAQEHLQRALAHLQATGIDNPAQDALRDMALSVLNRSS